MGLLTSRDAPARSEARLAMSHFDVTHALTHKRLLFAGATGFVGKVSLSMLLHRYGDVLGRVHVLVRKGSSASAERRFYDKIISSEPFQPLRDKHGGEEGTLAFVRKLCVIHGGDITDPGL